MFKDIDDIKNAGFTGFKTLKDLFHDSSALPSIKGVYMILNLEKKSPEFLEVGTGGYFKGKNPNVSISELNSNWVKDSIVIYIGKAGADGSSATLKSRLKQYFGFGQGKNIGHWGGRLIWQLKNSGDLVVCWKSLPNEDPRFVEINFIQAFVSKYKCRPFANLAN